MIEGLENVTRADSARTTKVDCTASVEEYINKEDWRISANANTGYSSAGLVNNLAGKVIANYWLDKVYTKKEGDSHRNGDYHIHDLDILGAYCCGHDLQRLLKEGFNGVRGRVGSNAPKHLREALGQMANFIGILQSEWAGAQAFSSFDTFLAPILFFDKYYCNINEKEIEKAIRSFVYNLNVPSRWGQSPFSNVTIDLKCPNDLKSQLPMRNTFVNTELLEQPFFISVRDESDTTSDNWKNLINELRNRIEGGQEMDEDSLLYSATYSIFEPEIKQMFSAYYKVMNEGDAFGVPFTFPIPTLNITEEFDWDNPAYDIVWDNTARYGSSYFQNFIGSQYIRDDEGKLTIKDENAYSPNDVRSMCPLTFDTEVIARSSQDVSSRKIGEMYHSQEKGTRYECFYNEEWISCEVVRTEPQNINKITLANNRTYEMGDYHLQPILRNGELMTVSAKDIVVGDALPFNTSSVNGNGVQSSYLLGYAVGAYLGDGSGKETITYSLDVNSKDDNTEKKLREFWEGNGYHVNTRITDRNCRMVVVTGNPYVLIEKFVVGDNALNKGISKNILSQSVEMRRGIIEGYKDTDGSREKSRIYTSSERMVNDLIFLFNSVGIKAYRSFIDNRDGRLGKNPNYVVSFIEERKNQAGKYVTVDGQLYWYVIKTENQKNTSRPLFCLSVDNDEHLFVLSDGLITHNCRLQLDKTAIRKRGGGLFGADAQTGSIGVVTINMARLGYLCKGKSIKVLLRRLYKLMDMAKSTLEKKRAVVKELNERGLFPYTQRYIRTFDTFFSTIGVNGMNECIRNFSNDKNDITDPVGQVMAMSILEKIRERLSQYQEETGNLYNLEATPAEGTTHRFAKEDIKRFPDIIQAGVPEAPYYTNSTQLPANFGPDVFEALDLQDELQKMYTGGTVLHIYSQEDVTGEHVKNLIKKVLSNYRLPYVSFTASFSTCPKHGRISGLHDYCPLCDAEILQKHLKQNL